MGILFDPWAMIYWSASERAKADISIVQDHASQQLLGTAYLNAIQIINDAADDWAKMDANKFIKLERALLERKKKKTSAGSEIVEIETIHAIRSILEYVRELAVSAELSLPGSLKIHRIPIRPSLIHKARQALHGKIA